MIEIKSLTKKFIDVTAINDLTISIDKGVTGLVGHNGAGKSTLFRLISGVYKIDNGTITIDGVNSQSKEGKSKVFFLSDDPWAPSGLTCGKMFELYSSYFNLDEEKFNELLNTFKLPKDRRVGNFSKGMKRQLFIAIALSSKCEVLLLDEVFDGIDPVVLTTIKDEIIKICAEKTIIISSHNITSLERICDRFVILYKGKVGKNAESTDLGSSFNKYQILTKNELSKEFLEELGTTIVSFKKVGSIYNVVFANEVDEEKITSAINPILFEKISIDSSELMALEMMFIQEKEEKKEEQIYEEVN